MLVSDKSDIFGNNLKNDADVNFDYNNQLIGKTTGRQRQVRQLQCLYVRSENFNSATDSIRIRTAKSPGLITRDKVEKRINNHIKEYKMLAYVSESAARIAPSVMPISISTAWKMKKTENKSGVAYVVGMVSGFLIYIVLFIYGTMVMRGVMEEKVNRIAEVIVSSVRPTQLMMGKILGIGAVGLVQFLIWIIFGLVINLVITPLIGVDSQTTAKMGEAAQQVQQQGGVAAFLAQINIPLVLGCFIFYFLGGYFLYSSLFAAVGSAVNEDPQDAQSLLLPVMIPIIIAIVIAMKAVNDPYQQPRSIRQSLPAHFPCGNDGACSSWYSGWPQHLGTDRKHAPLDPRFHRHYLGGCKDLPYRYPSLW